MVLKAYSSFVGNFTRAMDSVKETCRLVPVFMTFLKLSESFKIACMIFFVLLWRPGGGGHSFIKVTKAGKFDTKAFTYTAVQISI